MLAAALVSVGLLTALSAQASFLGAGKDAAGDSGDPNPARDIHAAAIAYDRRSGELRGGITLRGTPSEETNAFISLFAGMRTGTGCNGYPAIGFGSYSDEWGASWIRLDAPGRPAIHSSDADKLGFGGLTQEFEASSRKLAGRKPECVIATLSEPGNPANVYDAIGPLRVRALPELEASLSGVPENLRPGRQHPIKLVLRNPGDAPTGRVKLSVERARGLSAKLPRTVPSIRPGKRRAVTIRTTLSSRAEFSTTLSVGAVAGKLKALVEEDLYLDRPSSGGDNGGGAGDDSPQVCTRWIPDLSGESGGSLALVPC